MIVLFLLTPLCAIMGTLVVQLRMAFFSDAIAHSAFTGVALGLILGVDPRFSLIFFGMLIGIAIMRLRRKGDMAMDTTIGIIFSTSVALGLAILSAKKGLGRDLPGFLYGDILAIDDGEVVVAMILSLIVWVFLAFCYNNLLFISLHDRLARVVGIKVDALESVFAMVLALIVGFSIRAVGILLVTSLLVIPAAAARNVSGSTFSLVWIAVGLSLFASMAGLATSVFVDFAAGPAIILWSSGMFCVSICFKKN
ncbi:metal ABC transporter permease [bacterium]|nr:metal ABC transporter permease [bacterium]